MQLVHHRLFCRCDHGAAVFSSKLAISGDAYDRVFDRASPFLSWRDLAELVGGIPPEILL